MKIVKHNIKGTRQEDISYKTRNAAEMPVWISEVNREAKYEVTVIQKQKQKQMEKVKN